MAVKRVLRRRRVAKEHFDELIEGIMAQAEALFPKLDVEGSNPFARYTSIISCLEQFSFSYSRSTADRNTSNCEKPRGLKPTARNTETGNAIVMLQSSQTKRFTFSTMWG